MTIPYSNLINSGDVGGVIAQEYPPTRRGPAATPDHVLGNRRLGDVDTKLQQLTMNAWRSPQDILGAHVPNQGPEFVVHLWTADPAARLPTPVEAEAGAVPSGKRVGTDDQHGSGDRREESIEPDEEEAVSVREPHAAAQLAPQHNDLLPERRVLGVFRRNR